MAEPNRRIIVDGVDFRELFHFPRIFTAVFAALQPPRLLIALFMVLLLVSCGRLWDGLTGQEAFATVTELAGRSFAGLTSAIMAISLGALMIHLGRLFIDLPLVMWSEYKTFSIVYGLIFVFVMAVGGGAIARMAAQNVASHQRVPVRQALRFAMTRWVRLFIAPLMPLLAVAVVAAIIMLMGVLMLVPVLNIIGGMLYLVALLLGLLIAFLLIVYALAFLMVVPAMATEDCDGADAQQRAYGYVLSRPLHMVGYLLIALIGLTLGFFVVGLFATGVLNITPALYGIWTEDNPAMAVTAVADIFGVDRVSPEDVDARWHHVAAGWFINLWQTLIIGIVWAYVVSYFFSAATIVYLLMRRTCDGQDIEEIWQGNAYASPKPEDA